MMTNLSPAQLESIDVHKPILVTACRYCPFVRTRYDYCLANDYLGQDKFLWVNPYFIEGTRHPDCPLLADSIVICGDSDKAMAVAS